MAPDTQPHQGEPFELDARQLPSPPSATTDNERLLSALAYLSQLVLPVVLPALLLANRNTRQSGFVRQHATQAIALVAVGVIYYLLALLALLLLRGQAHVLVVGFWLILLPPVFVSLLYAVRALTGHWFEVPLLTDFLKDTGLL